MEPLTTNEVVALFNLDERRVRKEVEHGILKAPRFDLPDVVYLRTLVEIGFEMSAVEDRKRLHTLIVRAMREVAACLRIDLSPIAELKLDGLVRDVRANVQEFDAWKRHLVEDDRILGGEPVFPNSRLAVRHVGGMLLRGASAREVRADYPYLTADDIKFATLYARAYPRPGRPRERQAPAR